MKKSDMQIVADMITQIIHLVDAFDKDDLEILNQLRDEMKGNIGYNQAVSIVAVACGGQMYERGEDDAKIKELEGLITLVKARMELRGIVIEKASRFDGNKLYRG